MITLHGEDWLTAAEIAREIGPDITPAMLRAWRNRGLTRSATVGRGRTRAAYYPRPDVERAEATTRANPTGRPRQRTLQPA